MSPLPRLRPVLRIFKRVGKEGGEKRELEISSLTKKSCSTQPEELLKHCGAPARVCHWEGKERIFHSCSDIPRAWDDEERLSAVKSKKRDSHLILNAERKPARTIPQGLSTEFKSLIAYLEGRKRKLPLEEDRLV